MEKVLLFQGLTGEAIDWAKIIRGNKRFHFMAPNFSFHHLHEDPISIEDALLFDYELVERLVLKHSPCHFVGYSYGGGVLLNVMNKYQIRPLSLTLIEPLCFEFLKELSPSGFREMDEFVMNLLDLDQRGEYEESARQFCHFWKNARNGLFHRQAYIHMLAPKMRKTVYEFLPMYTRETSLRIPNPESYPVSLIRSSQNPVQMNLIMNSLEQFFGVKSQIIQGSDHLNLLKAGKLLNLAFEFGLSYEEIVYP